MKFTLSNYLLAAAIFFLPSSLARGLLRLSGFKVGRGCRFGYSIILVNKLHMAERVKVGHFNFVRVTELSMREGAYLGRLNIINGDVSILLDKFSAIGNSNKIVRSTINGVAWGKAKLQLGIYSKITSNHHVDCTQDIILGSYTTVAGISSQIWSHGYIHEMQGLGRYRIDGSVEIGDNVYIGSGCIISMGVRITSGAIVGAGVTVARCLNEPGLYVSAAMRQLPRPVDPELRSDLVVVQESNLCERVYLKHVKT